MTYEEAVQHKKSFKSANITDNGMTFFIFVTPENDVDFHRYATEIRGFFGNLTDEVAIRYSLNGQFNVKGLWCDGANIVHKTL